MTSAERAKEIVVSLIDDMLPSDGVTAGFGERWAALITAAITQAQNDKLEEAAAVVSSAAFLAGMNDRGPRYVRDLGDIANSIRSLKSKD